MIFIYLFFVLGWIYQIVDFMYDLKKILCNVSLKLNTLKMWKLIDKFFYLPLSPNSFKIMSFQLSNWRISNKNKSFSENCIIIFNTFIYNNNIIMNGKMIIIILQNNYDNDVIFNNNHNYNNS